MPSTKRVQRAAMPKMSAEKMQRRLQDLEARQAELQAQNATLRKSEQDLRALNECLTATLEASQVVVFSQDLDLKHTWIHNAAPGYEASGILGKTDREVVERAEDAQRTEAIKRTVLKTGRPRREAVPVWKNGIEHWYDLHAQPRRVDGEIVGVLCAAVDITRRITNEAALARLNADLETEVMERTAALRGSETRLRLCVQSANIGLWDWDLKTHDVYYSREWKSHLGLRDGEVPNHFEEWKRRVHPDDLAPALEKISAVIADPRVRYDVEFRLQHKDGSYRWINAQGEVLRDNDGNPLRMLGCHIDITERKQAEEALRESEERFRQLVHGLPVPVYTCDAKGRITLYNAAAVALWGREPRPGHDLWGGEHALFTPEGKHLPRSRSPIAAAVEQDEPIRDAELIIERHDGSRAHVLAFPDPIHDSSGTVAGAVNVMVDITQLKAAENALRTTQRGLRMLSRAVEQNPASILITSLSGEIDYVNPTFTEMTGYSIEDVLGKNPRILCSGEHPPDFFKDMWETIKAGRDWRAELCNRKKNGELFWSLAVIAPIHDENGHVGHFVEIMEDITERRRAAQEIHERRERLRAILNTVTDAIITIDRSGAINSVNPATEGMFGYTAEEMTGQNVCLLIPPPCHEEQDDYLATFHRIGHAPATGIGREAHGRRKDGSVFPIELAVSEVDHMHLFTGVIRDITDRRRLEAEVLRISEDERSRVSADLHDGICQELVGILFFTDALVSDLKKTRSPLAAQAASIREAIAKAAEQTRQVARGMTPVVREGHGLMLALRHLAGVISRTRRIRCVFECPAEVSIEDPIVANELYRITQEAIHNALRHGSAKRITVRLSDAGDQACLAVMDNGHGLPMDLSRATGMGLRVMKYRAGSVGGQLVIQPRKRGGSEVICRVPKTAMKI